MAYLEVGNKRVVAMWSLPFRAHSMPFIPEIIYHWKITIASRGSGLIISVLLETNLYIVDFHCKDLTS